MATETHAALHHFLDHEGKAVAEALRAEAARCWRFSDGVQNLTLPYEIWRNDRWQAAWRELCAESGLQIPYGEHLLVAALDAKGPMFLVWYDCRRPHKLTGEVLAHALRDIALSGALEENND